MADSNPRPPWVFGTLFFLSVFLNGIPKKNPNEGGKRKEAEPQRSRLPQRNFQRPRVSMEVEQKQTKISCRSNSQRPETF